MSGATYQLLIFHETPRAWMVGRERSDRENEKSFWLPKSQAQLEVEFTHKGQTLGHFIIPDWLAEKNGLDASLDGEDDGVLE